MRENRTCGSEGGEAQSLPYPYPGLITTAPLLASYPNNSGEWARAQSR